MEQKPDLHKMGRTMREYADRLGPVSSEQVALDALDRICLVDPSEPERGFRLRTESELRWKMSLTDGVPIPEV